MELLSVGEAFDDLIFGGLPRLPHPGEELRVPLFAATAGGGAVITAVATARLGLKVTLLSALGDVAARTIARENNLQVINLKAAHEPPAVSVALSTRRDRSFVTFAGVNTSLEPRLLSALTSLGATPRHVHFALSPRHPRRWMAVIARLHARGVTCSWDFGWNAQLPRTRAFASLLGAIDWLFLNEQEARLYTGAKTLAGATRRLAALPGAVVVKRGPLGALVHARGASMRARPPHARVIDTTGAGDAFNGGFLAAWLRSHDVAQSLRLGNYVGARSTEAMGGVDGLPARAGLPRWAARCLEAP